jgi:transcriptional regulator with XRE-family HTH domain
LRRLRKQKGLSLLEVEAVSEQEFKASVLGAYERGERAISAARMRRLAEIYRLPLPALLPPEPDAPPGGATSEGVMIDLVRAEEVDAPEARAVARYIRGVLARRGSWTGRVHGIRAEDVRALAAALDRGPEELLRRLDELGIRAW